MRRLPAAPIALAGWWVGITAEGDSLSFVEGD